MGEAYGVKPITDAKIKRTFGENLKALRKNAGLSRNEFAKKFSLSALSIGTYERGLRIPAPQTLFAMADFFDVSVDKLLGHGNYIPSKQTVIDEYRLHQAIKQLSTVGNVIPSDSDVNHSEYYLGVPAAEEKFFKDSDGIVRHVKPSENLICFGGASDLVNFTENVIQAALDSDKNFKEVFNEKAENLFTNSPFLITDKEIFDNNPDILRITGNYLVDTKTVKDFSKKSMQTDTACI